MSLEHPDLFPTLPRSTVTESKRDLWNEFRKAQEDLGGLVPAVAVCHVLKISRQRLHTLARNNAIRTYTILGYTSYSATDVKERLAMMRNPKFARGGYPMHSAVAAK